MQLNPYQPRGRRGIPWGNLALQAAGMGARAAYNYLNRPAPVQVPVYIPTANPPRAPSSAPKPKRGKTRRGRGGGPGPRNMRVTGGTFTVFQDTEYIAVTDTTVHQIPFSPGKTTLPRLDYEAAKYGRYKILYVNISYTTTSSMTNAGKFSFGVANQAVDMSKYDHGDIIKLRPSQSIATWKNTTINLGPNIMPTATLCANDDTDNGVAFTLVYKSSVVNPGNLKISYKIEFSFPHP